MGLHKVLRTVLNSAFTRAWHESPLIAVHILQYVSIAILVRHGESESNVQNVVSSDISGYPLTLKGRGQASLAGNQLSGLRINSFSSSPVQRAMETSSIISERIFMKPEVDERIIESGMDEYNNKMFTEIPKLKRTELGMASWESHQERFREALSDVEGVKLMVSHAFPIRAALSLYLDLNEEESYGISIRYASISVMDLENGEVLCIGARYLSERVRRGILSGIA